MEEMRFRDIPKRLEKSEYALDFGFWHRVRTMTNNIGDSPVLGVVITVITPIVTSLFSALFFMLFFSFADNISVEGLFSYMFLALAVVLIISIIQWSVYGYIGFISYHQIKYNINRVTGIISLALMLFSIPSLLFVLNLFSLGSINMS